MAGKYLATISVLYQAVPAATWLVVRAANQLTRYPTWDFCHHPPSPPEPMVPAHAIVASSWPNNHASLRMIMQYILSAHRQVAQTQDRSEQKRACGTHRRVGNVINIMCSFDHDDSGFPCSEYGIHVSTTLDWYPA